MAVAPDGVWVSVAGKAQSHCYAGLWEGGVVRIDPQTGRQTFASRFFSAGAGAAIGSMPLVVDGEDVWVASYSNDTVDDLDASTGRRKARVTVGDGPSYLALDRAGSLWVATIDSEELWQITTATGRVAKTVELRRRPIGLAAGDGRIWVATT